MDLSNFKLKKRFDYSKLESPIEKMMAESLESYLDLSSCEIILQHKVLKYRLDIVIDSEEYGKILIECDGKEFHDHAKDLHRDLNILEDGEILGIFRFNGSDINKHLIDCLYSIYTIYPKLFKFRFRHAIHTVEPQVKDQIPALRICEELSITILCHERKYCHTFNPIFRKL